MQVTVTINNCHQCRDADHSGSFTVRGARTICGHSDVVDTLKRLNEFKSKEDFKRDYPEYFERGDIDEHWKHHWYHRIVEDNKIPDWCPLKHGAGY